MAGKHVIEANDSTFEATVLASSEPVFVDFGATWCGPCKALAPIVESLAAEADGRYKVVTVDVDVAPTIAQRYGIRAVPTVMVFRGGEQRATRVGLSNKQTLLNLLDS